MPKCECGFEIVFAQLESGKLIPLDAKAPIYMVRIVEGEPSRFGQPVYRADRMGDSFMVSHFSTCRLANKFSNKNKEKKS